MNHLVLSGACQAQNSHQAPKVTSGMIETSLNKLNDACKSSNRDAASNFGIGNQPASLGLAHMMISHC